MNRRNFLAASSAALASLAVRPANAQTVPPLCVFSKHFQYLDYADLAKLCKDAGLDGVDLTVRDGGHVQPENVATDLPRAVDAIRSAGLDVPMITTRLESGEEGHAASVLEAASAQGIRYFRVGGHHYNDDANPVEQLEGIIGELRSLAALAERHDMVAGYHNHSGGTNFGAPVWDLLRAIETVGSPHLGSNFDVGHATIEGPHGDWGITSRALAPHVKMAAVKDFVFERNRPRWVPLGEGMVRIDDFLRTFRAAGFSGPVSIHFEYSEFNRARRSEKEEQLAAAGRHMRREYDKAGYAA